MYFQSSYLFKLFTQWYGEMEKCKCSYKYKVETWYSLLVAGIYKLYQFSGIAPKFSKNQIKTWISKLLFILELFALPS